MTRIEGAPPPRTDPPPAPFRLVVAAEVRLYREGLTEILSRRPEAEVVGTAATGEEALAEIGSTKPDLLLLDLSMPGAARVRDEARALVPETRLVALAVDESEATVLACAEAGMAGYVDCRASVDDLIGILHCVLRGELPCPPRIAGYLFRRVGALSQAAPAPPPPPAADLLTRRERQVLGLIDQGFSNKEIARRLHIGVSTVKNHVHNLLTKLGAQRRGAAAARLRA
jgi:two-component system, NarL family, nitrate/nitrite response regulator NarL